MMFDMHTHTNNSHDSKQGIDDLCRSAIEKGLKAVALTDHVDIQNYSEERNISVILSSAKDALHGNMVYGDKLKVLTGVEIGMFHYDFDKARKLCALADFDIILGSVHSFMMNGEKVHFSVSDISPMAISSEKLTLQTDRYFDEMLLTAQKADIDVLCHLTYPMRYINGKYNRGIDISIYSEKITRILKTLIERQVALEINTARVGTAYDYTAPTYDIISEYYALGGRLITLASDAHESEKIANGFRSVKDELKAMGFEEYYYYEKRKPQPVKL